MANKDKDSAEQSSAASSSTISVLQDRVSQLETENQRLRSNSAGNEQAQQSDSGGPTAAVASPGTPTVRHKGQITLRGGYFDLDAPQTDPQWGASANGAGGDIFRFISNAVATYGHATVLGLDSTPATYDSCSNGTGYSGQLQDLVAGSFFCVKTNDGRYSALKVIKVGNDFFTVDAVTYDPPGGG